MTRKAIALSDTTSIAEVPAHLQKFEGQADDGLITSFMSLPKLSIKGKQFRYQDQNGVEVVMPLGQPMNVVILRSDPPGVHMSKSFYEGVYKPDSADPPTCSAADGQRPDKFISEPVSKRCVDCPKNAWGSGVDQEGAPTKGKACSDSKLLFVIAADDLNGPICSLRVPATTLKALSVLGAQFKKRKLPTHVVVVQLSFADVTHPQLEFNLVEYLSEEEAAIATVRAESSELLDALPSVMQSPDAPAEDVAAEPAKVAELPAPPKPPAAVPVEPEYVMTDKAGATPRSDFYDKGWTDELLISNGYMVEGTPS